MVINTVLSLMACNYPPEKLTVYLSDDGWSDLTFYALLEASHFSKHWIPFCKKFSIEPRSPAAYFSSITNSVDDHLSKSKKFLSIKKLFEEMEHRINTAMKLGRISNEIKAQHKGFSEWDSGSSPRDHQTIVQILIDGRDQEAIDIEGSQLPSLIYLSREKRPEHHHNFKAGAMNSLIRVSANISNGSVILNVDCDMYSNNSESVRDALCFLMDEKEGQEIAFVQYPQCFINITKNDIYASSLRVEFPGLDGYGGPLYVGTGCFHRRETLCGKKYMKGYKFEFIEGFKRKEGSVSELEESSKFLANCVYEKGTQWGNEMGLKYGCAVEDVITGLAIQCRGWKSVFFNPTRQGFMGLPPTTLSQTLVQHKRWAEGDLQILLSKHGPLIHGFGKMKLGQQMGYHVYLLWAPSCFVFLYYLVVPPLYLLNGVSLFPKVSSPWFLPFAYVIVTVNYYSMVEFLQCGGTILAWWNEQRIWLFKRTTSYLFGFIDTIFKLVGFSKSAFDITVKVTELDVSQRYEQEIMEFGSPSPMFTILATLAMLHIFSLIWVFKWLFSSSFKGLALEALFLQVVMVSVMVLINLPVYHSMFFRKDKGRMPASVTIKATLFALLLCAMFYY
ncbi:hypothetical protein Sjap_006275 [Stephania japonica]|uniref:Cellulose synthase-like protein E1 n=1 Tax=Stephania japonica TaxID=461633 RepID=A0AAP0K801_9MAGN